MTGVAQHWYYMLERDAGDVTWPQFKALCQQRFGPTIITNHLSDLARLPFRGSVEEYLKAFEARMAHVGHLSPNQKVNLFTGGLPDPISTNAELQAPQDLQHAMLLARAYEWRNSPAIRPAAPRVQRHHGRQQPQGQAAAGPAGAPAALPSAPTPTLLAPPRLFRRLSLEEMTEHRHQGLCFNCDEQYVRGHKCARLFYVVVNDCVDDDDG